MRKFRVKVTCDYKKYLRWTGGSKDWIESDWPGGGEINGMYYNGFIWVRTLNPLTLFHEYIHHILGHSDDVWYISPRLFLDILHSFWDVAYWRLTRITTSWKRKQEAIRRIKESTKDWLDWVLCRDEEDEEGSISEKSK